MTTVLYTPGCLTVDSLRTHTQNKAGQKVTDQVAKIHRFYDPHDPLNEKEHLLFDGDIVSIGSGAGNVAAIDLILKQITVSGLLGVRTLSHAGEIFGLKHLHGFGECEVLLVGKESLHSIQLRHTKVGLSVTHHREALESTYVCGSGGTVAHMLSDLFHLEPELAVAVTGLYDRGTGGDVIRAQLDNTGVWKQERFVYRDPDDILEQLTDHFDEWNLGDYPFVLKHLPNRPTNAREHKPFSTPRRDAQKKAVAKKPKTK